MSAYERKLFPSSLEDIMKKKTAVSFCSHKILHHPNSLIIIHINRLHSSQSNDLDQWNVFGFWGRPRLMHQQAQHRQMFVIFKEVTG